MRRYWTLVFICLCLLPAILCAQPRQVSGSVKDQNGNPLPLVSVLEKGTNNGTTTNDQGAFTISVSRQNPVLVFSFTGMETQEMPVQKIGRASCRERV